MWHNCQWNNSSFYINFQSITKIDGMDQMNRMGQTRPKWIEWIKVDQTWLNGPKYYIDVAQRSVAIIDIMLQLLDII